MITRCRFCLAALAVLLAVQLGACLPYGSGASRAAAPATPVSWEYTLSEESYFPVRDAAADILGCRGEVSVQLSPVCHVGPLNAEEESAFRAEAERLSVHADDRCRKLGQAVERNLSRVLMYPKASVKLVGSKRYFGVGHAYPLNGEWLVRIARRIDDMNPRPLTQKTRTLRHEMAHTIGAQEEGTAGWSAEDYATNCAAS